MTMTHARRLTRSGISLAEVLIVISILGTLYLVVSPRIADVRAAASLRGSRQELTSAFASARAAALQKGKTSTLILSSTGATVTVQSGLTATDVQMYSIRVNRDLNTSIASVSGSPMTLQYDARGIITPLVAGGQPYKYRLLSGTVADTVCISPSGVILPKSCTL